MIFMLFIPVQNKVFLFYSFILNILFTFATVFHRILDFKAGLDFYPGPFFIITV
jgi:hypothetical protein